MQRLPKIVLLAGLCLGRAATGQAPAPEPLPMAAPPQPAHQYPPGVVDVTPEAMPAASAAPQCYFVPANDAVTPFVATAEYLLIRPSRPDLGYAIVDPNRNLIPEGSIANLEWQTRSGLRVGFLWRPRHGSTDLGFTYTYAYSQGSANLTAPAGGVLFPALTRPGLIDQALTAQAFSNIVFNVFDIDVGRRFCGDQTEYRVFTGVRMVDIGQLFSTTFDGLDAHQAIASNRSCMQGGGLTLGGEARWRFSHSFGAFARGRGSLVVGDYCVSAFESDFAGNVINTDVTDHFMKTVPVLDLAAGLSWQRRNWRASVGYELSQWFNQTESITFLDDFATGKYIRRQSDLSFEAITFQLAVEF